MFASPFDKNFAFVVLTENEQVDLHVLPEEEAILNSSVVKKRRQEFLYGRTAARKALNKLGVAANIPVLKGSLGEPIWPLGYTGSLTHSDQTIIAVVAPSSVVKSIGIDLQKIGGKLRYDISKHVCTDPEKNWLNAEHTFQREKMLLALFSAKESIYKALYPLCQQYFGFHDVELSFNNESKIFSGILLKDLPNGFNAGYPLVVRILWTEEWVFSYITII